MLNDKESNEDRESFIEHALCVSYPLVHVNLHILATLPSAGIEIPVKGRQKQGNIK